MAVTFLGAGRPPGFKVGTVYLAAETGGQDSEPRRVCSGLERGESFTLRLITDTKRGARVQGWSVLLKKQLNVNSFKILRFFFFWWQSFFGIPSGKQGLWFYCWRYTGKRGAHLGRPLGAWAPSTRLRHLMGGLLPRAGVCVHSSNRSMQGPASLLQELRRNFNYLFLNYWRLSWQRFIHHHQPPKDPSFKSVIEQQGSLQSEALPWTGSLCCI